MMRNIAVNSILSSFSVIIIIRNYFSPYYPFTHYFLSIFSFRAISEKAQTEMKLAENEEEVRQQEKISQQIGQFMQSIKNVRIFFCIY